MSIVLNVHPGVHLYIKADVINYAHCMHMIWLHDVFGEMENRDMDIN